MKLTNLQYLIFRGLQIHGIKGSRQNISLRSPWYKKSLETKFYHIKTLFWFQYNLIQKTSTENKSSYVGKCTGPKGVYTIKYKKRGGLYSICRCIEEKSKENVLDLTSLSLEFLLPFLLVFFFRYIFFGTLIPVILFPETFLAALTLFWLRLLYGAYWENSCEEILILILSVAWELRTYRKNCVWYWIE